MNTFFIITESEESIRRKVLTALKEEINRKFKKASENIEKRIKLITGDYLINTPEYSSMISGELFGEFGFYAGSQERVLSEIINKMVQQTKVSYKEVKSVLSSGEFSGGLSIGMIEADFKEILNDTNAIIRYQNKKGEIVDLQWLDWLLRRGNEIIVHDYHYTQSVGDIKSRSRQGIMKPNGSWRVPPKYAGTPRRNWITRALVGQIDILKKYISNIIQEEIERIPNIRTV